MNTHLIISTNEQLYDFIFNNSKYEHIKYLEITGFDTFDIRHLTYISYNVEMISIYSDILHKDLDYVDLSNYLSINVSILHLKKINKSYILPINLEELYVYSVTSVFDIPNIKVLSITCKNISMLSKLSYPATLETLILNQINMEILFKVLLESPNLKKIEFDGFNVDIINKIPKHIDVTCNVTNTCNQSKLKRSCYVCILEGEHISLYGFTKYKNITYNSYKIYPF